MNFEATEGDYSVMGVTCQRDSMIFTFECEKELECAVRLIHQTGREYLRIPVPGEYCHGSLRSIQVQGLSWKDYWYLYEIDQQTIVDPYATAIAGREKWNDHTRGQFHYEIYGKPNPLSIPKDKDCPPEIAKEDMVLYKLHVRGFTMGKTNRKKTSGTFAGISDRISYLKDLGITTVEIMPCYEFEELITQTPKKLPGYVRKNSGFREGYVRNTPESEEGYDRKLPDTEENKEKEKDKVKVTNTVTDTVQKLNYWGYTHGYYFAVKASYASEWEHASLEFYRMVRKFHENGMECIMEMYFRNDCRETIILDALLFWVRNYHVDGFHLIGNTLPLNLILEHPELKRVKLFCGQFSPLDPGKTGKYRRLYTYTDEFLYPVRKMLNHKNSDMTEFAGQLRKQGNNLGYVNYIANNNGFTLADVFSYNDKHNEENGEDNTDGSNCNFSSNYGMEGITKKRFIQELRRRQWKNAIMILFLAQGVPLLLQGDEVRNSQKGNNNAYCQDNETGWVNWPDFKKNPSDYEFVRNMIAFRRKYPLLHPKTPFTLCDSLSTGLPDLSYHGEKAWIPGVNASMMSIGMLYHGAYSPDTANTDSIYAGFNFYCRKSVLALPQLGKGRRWYLAADSSRCGQEFMDSLTEPDSQQSIELSPQSIVILIGKQEDWEYGRK